METTETMQDDINDFTTEPRDFDSLLRDSQEPRRSHSQKIPSIFDWAEIKRYIHYQSIQILRLFLGIAFVHWFINKFQDFFLAILKMGPLPQSISFVMDGNRRYAKSLGLPIKSGHESGAIALMKVLRICKKLGIETVSAYAFSIENFNRPQEEVDTLINLLAEKLDEVARRAIDVKNELYGLKLRVVGERSMISKELNDKITHVERMTDNGDQFTLYICFPYTSRNDIFHAIYNNVEKCKYHALPINSLSTENLTEEMFFGKYSNKCDLLIRTSGHTRLSDYMLWQVHENGVIEFSNTLWPDFTFKEFYGILLKWSFFSSIQKKKLTKFSLRNQAVDFLKYRVLLHRQNVVPLEALPDPPQMISVADRC